MFADAGNGWSAAYCAAVSLGLAHANQLLHFRDCQRASGHESVSCKKHYSKYRTFIFTNCCEFDV